MMNNICRRCKFWRAITDDGGFCRRDSPVTLSDGKTAWPFTLSSDWCGEYAPGTSQWERVGDVAARVLAKMDVSDRVCGNIQRAEKAIKSLESPLKSRSRKDTEQGELE